MQEAISINSLLEEIEQFCRKSDIAETTFGRLAVNDGKLCHRLRTGRNVTITTIDRIHNYIRTHQSNLVTAADGNSSKIGTNVISRALISSSAGITPSGKRPFRFYDNRQKYLAFVNTCNEKWKIAERSAHELSHIHPRPPALRMFDAGLGDGSVLSYLLRAMHRKFPTIPFFVVGKEISLEDIRLTLEKLPDRFVEHPASVIVLTNLHYTEAPWLMPSSVSSAAALNWHEVALQGGSAQEYSEQLRAIDDVLVDGWEVKASEKTGNPLYVRPSVLVIFREDSRFLLDSVIPRRGQVEGNYDLILAIQPWRARMNTRFKVEKVLAPLVRSLAPGGRMLTVQSFGKDPGLELIREIWPDEDPFQVSRHDLLKTLKEVLGRVSANYNFNAASDAKSVFRYDMHTLASEIDESIGTSTLYAAWNASIYVYQIEDERLEPIISSGAYLEATAKALQKHNGMWFNDETFVVSRRNRTAISSSSGGSIV